jgi:hypothetical protein
MLALALASFAHAPAADLFEKPFRWRDARGIVDLENGRTAPTLVDLDADGVCDLVVGTNSEGQLLWYRNAGTPKAPRFVDPAWTQLPRQDTRTWVVEGAPILADLDGDGFPDLLAFVAGEAVFSRGLGQRTFAPPRGLHARGGVSVRVAGNSSPAVCDWDGDGNPDLVAVDADGKLRVQPLLGLKGAEPALGPATALELVENEPVPKLAPAALVVDWDGDGVLDLLVGSSEGSVVFYKGCVEQGVNRVQPGEVLLQPCYVDQPATLAKNEKTGALEPQLTRSHRCPRLAVCDWNGDGRLDLLVGDLFNALGPEPQLTKEQAAQRDELRAQTDEAWKQLHVVRKEIEDRVAQDLGRLGLQEVLGPALEVREALLRLRRKEDARDSTLTRRLEGLAKELEPLTARPQRHGYIWVYLRKGATIANAK